MAEQFDGNGISITFLCGPMAQQLVEITIGTTQIRMNISEYADLFFRANSEANRRLSMEKNRLTK